MLNHSIHRHSLQRVKYLHSEVFCLGHFVQVCCPGQCLCRAEIYHVCLEARLQKEINHSSSTWETRGWLIFPTPRVGVQACIRHCVNMPLFKTRNCTCFNRGQESKSQGACVRTVQPPWYAVVRLELLQQGFRCAIRGLYSFCPLASDSFNIFFYYFFFHYHENWKITWKRSETGVTGVSWVVIIPYKTMSHHMVVWFPPFLRQQIQSEKLLSFGELDPNPRLLPFMWNRQKKKIFKS